MIHNWAELYYPPGYWQCSNAALALIVFLSPIIAAYSVSVVRWRRDISIVLFPGRASLSEYAVATARATFNDWANESISARVRRSVHILDECICS